MPAETTDLKVAIQDTDQAWSRRISVTVPAERVQRTRSAVAAQVTRNVRLPGFRKGKLPPQIVEKRFGPSIEQETLDRTIQDAYREALDAQEMAPINQGTIDKIEYEPGSDLVFEVAFEVRPEPELARLSGFSATRPAVNIGDDEADAVLERLRTDRGSWTPLDEVATPDYGDEVMVEITAREGEDAEEPRDYRFVLGEGQAIPMVEESILTLRAGEEGDFTIQFPDDFPDEAQRGAEQQLHIRVLEAKRRDLPELNDEFARSVGDFADLPALRERILTDVREDAERRADADVRGQLLDQILEANPVSVPGSMTERYLQMMMRAPGEADQVRTPEQEEQLAKMLEGLRPQAEDNLKRMIVVERIAEVEGLRATQDEVDERVEQIAKRHDRSPSEVWIQLEKSGQLEALEREITEDKVFVHLQSQNTVEQQ